MAAPHPLAERIATTPGVTPRWLREIQLASGVIAVVLGCTVLTGWYLHRTVIIQLNPAFAPMQRNTALGFVLCGIGLLLLYGERSRLAQVCGGVTAGLALLTLLEHASGANFGIDELLGTAYITVKAQEPGRMSTATAVCFFMTGLALVSLAGKPLSRRRSTTSALLGSSVAAVGLATGVGYLLGLSESFAGGNLTRIAFHSAGGFTVIGAGVVSRAWRPETGEAGWPQWLPIAAGLAVATGTLGMWHAITAQERYRLPFLSAALLVACVAMALLLALALRLTYQGMQRSKELVRSNLLLGQQIAEHEITEKALRGSEARLRAVVETAHEAIVSADSNGNIIYFSPGAESAFGWSASEAVGRPLTVLMPERFHEPHRQGLERYLATQQAHVIGKSVELVGRRKDGSEFPVDLSLASWSTDEGTFFTGILRDITERKQAQEALERQTAKLREQAVLIDLAHDAIFVRDLNNAIIVWNLGAAEMYGWSKEEALEKDPHTLLRTDFPRPQPEIKAELFRTGRWEGELVHTTRDGSTMVVASRWALLRDEQGKPLAILEINTDITVRKRAEEALREKNVELQNAAQAKDRFLANMSHELRTPLNAVIGFTGTLLMQLPGPLNEEQSKQLRTIQNSAKLLLSLINDLLDLAKIGSGKVTLALEPVVVQGVVQEVSGTLRPLAESKGLDLKVALPEEHVVLKTDRRALSQILLNLANNAIKFTERGEVGIVLERQSENGKSWVQLSVHDTGIGIHAEDQPRLFQPFSQLERAVRRPQQGTGLGLQLSQRLAELLGGQISFKSEYGTGSIFTLSLPEN